MLLKCKEYLNVAQMIQILIFLQLIYVRKQKTAVITSIVQFMAMKNRSFVKLMIKTHQQEHKSLLPFPWYFYFLLYHMKWQRGARKCNIYIKNAFLSAPAIQFFTHKYSMNISLLKLKP